MTIERLHTNDRMSQVVIHNDTVYLAGQVALKAPGASVAEQTKAILDQIDGLLAEAGTDKLKALAATPSEELDFEFGTGPGDAELMSSQAALSALTQLLTVLIEKGIISKEEVATRLRPFL